MDLVLLKSYGQFSLLNAYDINIGEEDIILNDSFLGIFCQGLYDK